MPFPLMTIGAARCLSRIANYAPAHPFKTGKHRTMKYLHTMVRVTDVDKSLAFYRDILGLKEVRRNVNEKGRYTLIFLAAPGQEETPVELTYNWDPEAYT